MSQGHIIECIRVYIVDLDNRSLRLHYLRCQDFIVSLSVSSCQEAFFSRFFLVKISLKKISSRRNRARRNGETRVFDPEIRVCSVTSGGVFKGCVDSDGSDFPTRDSIFRRQVVRKSAPSMDHKPSSLDFLSRDWIRTHTVAFF